MKKKPKILRLLLSVSESSGPFNQFTYPFGDTQNISLCLYKKPKMLIKDNIDVINASGSILRFLIQVWKESRQDYDIVQIHHANLSLLILIFIRFSSEKKTIFTLGTCYKNLKSRHRIFLYISRKFFTNFVCCSEAVYSSIPKWFMSSNMSVIRHGINLDRIGSAVKKDQIFVATRIIKQKNIEWIIKGFTASSHLHSYQLILAGDGALRIELEGLVKNLNMADRISFLGACTRDKVLSLMAESRFYISASESDGMPIAVLEAVASGCIPILLDTPPHFEVLEKGVFGFSFSDMESGIANLILKAASYNTEELDTKRQNNIRVSAREFGTETMMNRYMEL